MATADTGQAPSPADKCDPNCPDTPPGPGPVREAGGTTGAGNLSPARASRTGGATGGVASDPDAGRPARAGEVRPSA
jgi:hypothetical protein